MFLIPLYPLYTILRDAEIHKGMGGKTDSNDRMVRASRLLPSQCLQFLREFANVALRGRAPVC
eukprot:9137753-Pyramimonas_sp.AAC.1